YDLGYAAGLYSGSQTISAAMGLSTDAINRLGLPPDQAKALLDSMPIAYAVTYMFGTMGSAVVIAIIGPKLLGINLVAACKDYEEKFGGGKKELGGPGTGWTRWALRAYKVQPGGKAAGLRVAEAESLVPDTRIFILRIRRGGEIMDATADTVLKEGDVVAVAGAREVLVNVLGAPVLWTHSDAHRLVHELGRPEYLHRHCRHLCRTRVRQRPEDAGRRPVPLGRRGNDNPFGYWDVRRQVRVPLPRRAQPRNC